MGERIKGGAAAAAGRNQHARTAVRHLGHRTALQLQTFAAA